MAELFDRLLKKANQHDQEYLNMAHNGWNAAMLAYQESPTKRTKEDFDAARQLYDDVLRQLSEKYFLLESSPPIVGERFKNRKQALEWMVGQGYKISRGKFYKDCNDGFLAVYRSGAVSRYQVMQYAQKHDVSLRSLEDKTDYALEKERLEVEKLRHEVARRAAEAHRENDKWIKKDEAWIALAALVGTLLDNLRHHFHTGQDKLVYLAGGKHECGPSMYAGTEELITAAFNDLAKSGIVESVFDNKAQSEC